MRIRLTTIALQLDGKLYPEGSELTVGVDIPEHIAEARLRHGGAERVRDGGVSEAFDSAMARFITAWREVAEATTALTGMAFDGTDAEALVFSRALAGLTLPPPDADMLSSIQRRAAAEADRLATKVPPRDSSQTAVSEAPPADSVSTSAGGEAAGGDAASELTADDLAGMAEMSAALRDSSADERLAHNQEDAGSNPAPAPSSTDTAVEPAAASSSNPKKPAKPKAARQKA